MPSWLVNYPGVTPASRQNGSNLETTYTTAAAPELVVAHYGKLFEAAGLAFQPNPDGMGTAIRGAAAECDLLILVYRQRESTHVEVNCAARVAATAAAAQPADVPVITGSSPSSRGKTPPRPAAPVAHPAQAPLSAADMQARHAQLVKEMGIHPEYRDAPAPPLAWPSWLVRFGGGDLRLQKGVDQSRKEYLEAVYTTTQPMSAIYRFYLDLLNGNEYPVHNSELATGHTISGVQQNALGDVEGTNYPNGAPGPRTVIRVSFSRSYLNAPITVRIRFTAYEFVAHK